MRKGYDVAKEGRKGGRKEGTHPPATGPSLPPALVARWPDFNYFGNLPVGELASPAYGTIQSTDRFQGHRRIQNLSLSISLSLSTHHSAHSYNQRVGIEIHSWIVDPKIARSRLSAKKTIP